MSGITRDTQFLAKNLVMDYSLLVGVDETNNQLLIGVIGQLISHCSSDHTLFISWKINIALVSLLALLSAIGSTLHSYQA